MPIVGSNCMNCEETPFCSKVQRLRVMAQKELLESPCFILVSHSLSFLHGTVSKTAATSHRECETISALTTLITPELQMAHEQTPAGSWEPHAPVCQTLLSETGVAVTVGADALTGRPKMRLPLSHLLQELNSFSSLHTGPQRRRKCSKVVCE